MRAGQCMQHDLEFQAGLSKLGFRVRIGDNAAASKQAGYTAIDQTGAQGNGELTMTVRVDPAQRRGVPAAIQLLRLANRCQRVLAGEAANSRRGVQVRQQIENAASWQQLA